VIPEDALTPSPSFTPSINNLVTATGLKPYVLFYYSCAFSFVEIVRLFVCAPNFNINEGISLPYLTITPFYVAALMSVISNSNNDSKSQSCVLQLLLSRPDLNVNEGKRERRTFLNQCFEESPLAVAVATGRSEAVRLILTSLPSWERVRERQEILLKKEQDKEKSGDDVREVILDEPLQMYVSSAKNKQNNENVSLLVSPFKVISCGEKNSSSPSSSSSSPSSSSSSSSSSLSLPSSLFLFPPHRSIDLDRGVSLSLLHPVVVDAGYHSYVQYYMGKKGKPKIRIKKKKDETFFLGAKKKKDKVVGKDLKKKKKGEKQKDGDDICENISDETWNSNNNSEDTDGRDREDPGEMEVVMSEICSEWKDGEEKALLVKERSNSVSLIESDDGADVVHTTTTALSTSFKSHKSLYERTRNKKDFFEEEKAEPVTNIERCLPVFDHKSRASGAPVLLPSSFPPNSSYGASFFSLKYEKNTLFVHLIPKCFINKKKKKESENNINIDNSNDEQSLLNESGTSYDFDINSSKRKDAVLLQSLDFILIPFNTYPFTYSFSADPFLLHQIQAARDPKTGVIFSLPYSLLYKSLMSFVINSLTPQKYLNAMPPLIYNTWKCCDKEDEKPYVYRPPLRTSFSPFEENCECSKCRKGILKSECHC
jgi:hypothetical protein